MSSYRCKVCGQLADVWGCSTNDIAIGRAHLGLTPETIQDLERCAAELFDLYRRAMEAAKPIEREGRKLEAWVAGEAMGPIAAELYGYERARSVHYDDNKALRDRYHRERARFRGQANKYRRRAETILAVLSWAAPDKQREQRL
jgi:hypothetical protein